MDSYYKNFPHDAAAYVHKPGMMSRILSEAVVCHFWIKSEADFERRVRRGTAGDFGTQTVWGDAKQTGHHEAILKVSNAVEFTGLRDYWRKLHAPASIPSAISPPPGPNLALGKAALQSSISPWSIHPTIEADAAGAVNGAITGRHQFHTAEEDRPWWQVDLGEKKQIFQIHLYNRLDVAPDRARHITISLSDDGTTWREIFRKTDDRIFGGIDGFPLRWSTQSPVEGRFLRIALIGRGFLHLDQVEVYGDAIR